MSSREIAELTGKRPDPVIRDIRVMLAELGDAPGLGNVREERDARGYTACFHLPKELTLTLVAGYSVPLRHRIVTRWMELEQAQAARAGIYMPNFVDPAEAPLAWIKEFKAKQAAEAQALQFQQLLALAAPKVEAFDTLIHDRKDSLSGGARSIPGVNSQAIKPFACQHLFSWASAGPGHNQGLNPDPR